MSAQIIRHPKNNSFGDEWKDDLILTATKNPKPLLANAITSFRRAPEWQGVLAYDEFALVTLLMRAPPWNRHQHNNWTPTPWTDRDDALATNWLQHQGINVNLSVATTAALTVAKDASFHPIKNYLNGLKWGGVPRVANFASNYLGADPSPYNEAVSNNMFIAAVARIMSPGCKVDSVPILEGTQGKGKSTAIEILFRPWFSDDIAELGSKDAAMQIRSAWCIEIAELASMGRADLEKVKAFITRRVDRFRPSYGRHVIEVPRQSVLFGTTNNDAYLKDETGGRRFWPIHCSGKIDLAAIERDRDQLWAEAVKLFNAGTPWWFTDSGTIDAAREEQDARYIGDPWENLIAVFTQSQPSVSVAEVLMSLGLEKGRWTQAEQNRVARCLKTIGWERYRGSSPLREWRYRPLSQ
jgi:predicted P-loop ATPase